ncbi:MAG: enoyl-CoA hydratase/isomerase family protein [Oceanicaulis sp.]|nr:enoyl-CoA hydratase/isomerase family protein [Oceanicaulis sp.]
MRGRRKEAQMTYDHIQTYRDDAVLTIRMHRPDAMNALIPPMLEELIDAFHRAESANGPSVIIVEGAGRAFSAGVDLKVLSGAQPKAGRSGQCLTNPPAGSCRRCAPAPNPSSPKSMALLHRRAGIRPALRLHPHHRRYKIRRHSRQIRHSPHLGDEPDPGGCGGAAPRQGDFLLCAHLQRKRRRRLGFGERQS